MIAMRVQWEDIPPEGLEVALEEVGDLPLKGPKGSLEEKMRLASPVRGKLSLKREKRGVVIRGDFRCTVFIRCARCLKEFELPISEDFESLYLHIRYAPQEDEVELSAKDMEVGFLREETVEVEEILRERIWLSIPMKPLCKEDCRGLCPTCGKDLNEGDCGCPKEALDPRFAILKDLKLSLKG
ncbi:MAG: hypothetical protein DRG55_03700 [Deltaproteobacteria bacterium]|nr:MAG: hypothetical protein DRG55_03700 [Deltaproteobacteria bacterium]